MASTTTGTASTKEISSRRGEGRRTGRGGHGSPHPGPAQRKGNREARGGRSTKRPGGPEGGGPGVAGLPDFGDQGVEGDGGGVGDGGGFCGQVDQIGHAVEG